jgi:transposase
MRKLLQAEYDQMLLLPPSVEDWVGPEHAARFIREVVEQTDLRALGLKLPNEVEGGTCFGASLLLGVWLYGYFRKVRSTRALERACREDLAFVWLSGNHRPDHNALWRFWNTNREGLRGFFKHTVALAMEMDLVGFAVQAVDGTKLPAVCAARQSGNREYLQRLLERLEEQLAQQEAELVQSEESAAAPCEGLPEELQGKLTLRDKVRAALKTLEGQGRRHVHPQEPEAVRLALAEGGNRFGYNAQVAVDARAQIITAHEVMAQSNDLNLALPMGQQACENTGRQSAQLMVDAGYCTAQTIGQAEAAGVCLLMPLPKAMEAPAHEPYHSSRFGHDESRDVVICPQGQTLPFRKQRLRHGSLKVRVYRNGKACHCCAAKAQCTRARAGRSIDITGYEAAVARHRERMRQPQAQHHYRRRAAVVEPVFARIKHHAQFRRFTLRGLDKARTQWALICSTANLQRLYTFWRQ